MPTIVEVNGQEFEFPDSMSQDQIKSVLDQRFSQQPEQPTQPIMAGRRRRPQQPEIIEPVYAPEEQALGESSVDAALALAGDVPSQAPMQQEQSETITVGRGRNRRTIQQQPSRTALDTAEGVYETIKAMGLGGAFGSFGALGGVAEGAIKEAITGGFSLDPEKQMQAARRIQELSETRAAEFARPFAPQSEVGREMTANVAEVIGKLPVIPQLAFEAPIIQQFAKKGAALAPAKLENINTAIKEGADAIRAQAMARNQEIAKAPIGSVGAQAIDIAQVRDEAARSLPVPIRLTEGQATREFGQQRFEGETAKQGELGKPLRERFTEQNEQLIQNFDAFIDETGAELYYATEVGESVEKAIRLDAAKDMKRIRRLYNDARTAGEMSRKVDLSPLSNYLNVNRAERAENSIMTKVQRQLEVLEVASGSLEDGTLKVKPMSLNQAEAVRRFINRNVNDADPNDIRIASNLKNLIDGSTEGEGGAKYKAARKARREYAEKFENVGLINNILSTKRGTQDRIIALEDVARKSIISPSTSRQSTWHLRKILQNAGEEGQQAWRELQGATLRHIQDQMTRNVARNEKGDPIVSASALDREVNSLKRSGKLELVFGKKGAEQIDTINELAKVVLTVPPGTVNTSNTATLLAAMLDVAVSGTVSIPAPAFTAMKLMADGIKEKKLKAKVNKALRLTENEEK